MEQFLAPLLGEVARRSRDGEVSGLGGDGIFGFLMGIEAKQSVATPQALRASSTRKGMATHAQPRLRLAVRLTGKPKIAADY